MLLLFWRPRPVNLYVGDDLVEAGNSDAEVSASTRVVAGPFSALATAAGSTVYTGLGYGITPVAHGTSTADLSLAVAMAPLFESGAGADANFKTRAWDRVRVTIDTFDLEMRAEALEP